jgi:hypothetical protein
VAKEYGDFGDDAMRDPSIKDFFLGGGSMDPFAAMGPPSFRGGSAGPAMSSSNSTMASSFIFQPGGSTAEKVAAWIVPALIAGAALWLLKR